jgi:hydroxymethylpyrimidine pyrophosphatase-like HAD family hydrolase
MIGEGGPTIAAGDDLNDISMLEVADVKIAIAGAPPELLSIATIVAQHGAQHGIIEALTKAVRIVK